MHGEIGLEAGGSRMVPVNGFNLGLGHGMESMSNEPNSASPDDLEQAVERLHEGDVDGAVELLLATPGPWSHRGAALATALADIVVEADPAVAARLLGLAALTAEIDGTWVSAADARQLEVVALARSKDVAGAAAALERAVASAERIADEFDGAVAFANLSARLNAAGLYRESAGIAEIALQRARLLNESDGSQDASRVAAAAAVNLACAFLELGTLEHVGALLGEAQQRYRQLGDEVHSGNVKVNQAMLASVEGRLHDEREAYAQAAAHYEAGDAPAGDVGFAVRGEAASLAQVGRFSDAIERYRRAHDLFVSVGLLAEARRTTTGMIMARSSNGETFASSELDALEAEMADMAISDSADRARNLANIRLAQDDVSGALPLYQRAHDAYAALGRRVEAARVRSSRGAAFRKVGDLAAAEQELRAARTLLAEEGRWIQAAHADHNIALVLRDRADLGASPVAAAGLRADALDRSLDAISTLDQFRHRLPTAVDRQSLQTRTYAPIFPVAVALSTAIDAGDVVAAVIERSRVQPVLAATTGTEQHRFADPAPIAARRSSRAVGGSGRLITLASLSRHLAGDGASWLGWWIDGTTLLRTRVTQTSTVVEQSAWDDTPRRRVASALAVPTEDELAAARGDVRIATCLAVARAARGPLVRDAALARGAEAALPMHLLDVGPRHTPGATEGDAELLWPLARLLFGDAYIAQLATRDPERRERLVVAPPPLLGRIPWAALPVEDPRQAQGADARRLVEVADVVVGLPASLAGSARRDVCPPGGGRHLFVRDPLGDLRFARRVQAVDACVLGHGGRSATREALVAELARGAGQLTLCAHVRPGDDDNPAQSAILLRGGDSAFDAVTVGQLSDLAVPPTCVLLVCDGAGAATGAEWTGVATGLVWAGARWIVTTTWPTLDDEASASSDSRLLALIDQLGPHDGTWEWQRRELERRRAAPDDSETAPHRWAGTIVTGSGGRASARRAVTQKRSTASLPL